MQKVLIGFVAVASALAWMPELSGSPLVFLLRHAEKANQEDKDSSLSGPGRRRAEALGRMLRTAGVRQVIATEYKRTQETAAPIAASAGVEVAIVPAEDLLTLVRKLRGMEGNSVVVGHSNTLPGIARALGVPNDGVIGEDEYDQLWIVSLSDRPSLTRMRLPSPNER